MSTESWSGRISVIAIMLACGAWLGPPVAAQGTAPTPGSDTLESDPIRCWWKTDKSAVQAGEHFTLLLTCGVIDIARIKVEADPSKLDPAAVTLAPFEVLGGTRFEDVLAPPWRYFQYAYTVRLIGDEFFGKNVAIPSLQITYDITSTAGGDQTEGREQLYELPQLPIRMLSLVPAAAADIRDLSSETFADVETRRFRATAAFVASTIFFGFAVVLAGLAVVRLASRYRSRLPAADRPMPSGGLLRGCLGAVDRLRSDVAREGWTHDLAQRALALLRIAGAIAMGRPVTQTVVNHDAPEREGQLALRKGRLRPRRALVSAPTTTAAIAAQLGNGGGRGFGPSTVAVLEEIHDSLRVFNVARYGRSGQLERDTLDTALDRGAGAIRQLYAMKRWPARAAEALKGARLGVTAWSR